MAKIDSLSANLNLWNHDLNVQANWTLLVKILIGQLLVKIELDKTLIGFLIQYII